MRLSPLTLPPVLGNDMSSNPVTESPRNQPNAVPRGSSINDPQGTNFDQGAQPRQQETLHRRNQTQRIGVQTQMQSSSTNGQQMNFHGGDANILENNGRIQSPFQQRQEPPFAFNDSPLPSLPGDIFADQARFDDSLRDMDNRTDFYDNLSFVLSGSYE